MSLESNAHWVRRFPHNEPIPIPSYPKSSRHAAAPRGTAGMHLLMLGAGIMQLPAIEAAQRLGMKVIAADGNPDACGKAYADMFVQIDLHDYTALIDFVRSRTGTRLNAVYTAGTDFSHSVAHIAHALDLPGISLDAARNATNKAAMRTQFARCNVASPPFAIIPCHKNAQSSMYGSAPNSPPSVSRTAITDAVAHLRMPIVVKPVDNMGGRGVSIAHTGGEIIEAVERAAPYSRTHTVIAEEFIAGQEYSIDAILYDSAIIVCGIAERHIDFQPWAIERGHTMPAVLPEHDIQSIVEIVRQGSRALGIERGAVKGDIFLTSKGAVIGELAARLSGGYMSGWTYPYASGIDPNIWAIRIAAGLSPFPILDTSQGKPPCRIIPRYTRCSAEKAVISMPGAVAAIEGIAEARHIPEVCNIFVRISAGDEVQFPRNNVEKCLNIITAHPRRTSALDAAVQAIRRIHIILKPGQSESCNFLFGTSRTRYPAALSLEIPDNIALLRTLQTLWHTDHAAGEKFLPPPKPMPIIPIPCIADEPAQDWHHHTIAHILALLAAEGRITYAAADIQGDTLHHIYSALFWQSVTKAGLQGGRFLIDTLNEQLQKLLSWIPYWDGKIDGITTTASSSAASRGMPPASASASSSFS